MAGQIRVNTAQVAQIADSIASLNTKLSDELTTSRSSVGSLATTWEGEASRETIAAFEEFANKYFDDYYKIIDNYVNFLKVNVDSGYFETETVNTKISDAFK